MTWYWRQEGDSIVIREEREDDEEGEYIAEIDVRYMTPADREKARAVANHIIGMENARTQPAKEPPQCRSTD